jgi:hypothetical protein
MLAIHTPSFWARQLHQLHPALQVARSGSTSPVGFAAIVLQLLVLLLMLQAPLKPLAAVSELLAAG